MTLKPLANGGIGDTEMIDPRGFYPSPHVLTSSSCPRPCAQSRPSNSCLIAIASATHCPPLFSPTPPLSTILLSRYPCLQAPSDLNASLVSFPLRAFACVRARCFRGPIVLRFGLLLYYFQLYFLLDYRPLWPCVTLWWLPVFLLCLIVLSCALSRVFSPSPSSLHPPYPFHPL